MRRRDFIKAIVGSAAAWPLTARAQQQAMSVIGLLTATSLNFDQLKSIQKGFEESGYVEGRNLAIVYRSADSQYERLPMLAADLVDRKVSVTHALESARQLLPLSGPRSRQRSWSYCWKSRLG